jgi:hypothetical protein
MSALKSLLSASLQPSIHEKRAFVGKANMMLQEGIVHFLVAGGESELTSIKGGNDCPSTAICETSFKNVILKRGIENCTNTKTGLRTGGTRGMLLFKLCFGWSVQCKNFPPLKHSTELQPGCETRPLWLERRSSFFGWRRAEDKST